MNDSAINNSIKNSPDNFVIVIGRQFGSGGRSVGKIIAKKLGIDYYDSEILDQAAGSEGVKPEILRQHEEKKPSMFKAILQGAYGIADNFHIVPISGERTYNLQCKVIHEAAKKGSCVIVGRNADFILKEHPRLFSVFLQSPLDIRVKKIMQRGEAISHEEARQLAIRHDKRREAYYNFYTGEKKWGVAANYHLCIDTSMLDNESIADFIIKFMQKRGLSLPQNEAEESPGNTGQHAF